MRKFTWGHLEALLRLAWREPRLSSMALAAALGGCGAACLAPLAQRMLIDALSVSDQMRTLAALVALATVVGITRAGTAVQGYCCGVLNVRLYQMLKKQMFRHLLGLPSGVLRQEGAGYFFNRTQHDIDVVNGFSSGTVFLLLSNGVKALGGLAVIFTLQWYFGMLLLPFLLLQIGIFFFFRRRQFELNMRIHESSAQERHATQNFFDCQTLLQTHAGEEMAASALASQLEVCGDLKLERLRHERWFMGVLQLPVWLCCGAVFLVGVFYVLEKSWTLGELWALVALMLLVFNPARLVAAGLFQLQSASAAWGRLEELRALQPELDPERPGRPVERLRGEIVFEQVSFAYPRTGQLLTDFELRIKPGETIFITGPNGCGKSTLLALLLRLYEPARGVIRVDGVALTEYDVRQYRRRIGYVGQITEFFRGTLRDNLVLGEVAGDDRLWQVLETVEMAERIRKLPGGLDYLLEEHCGNFSVGERLRLALARELLREVDILIFDEAGASLDTESERLFYRLLAERCGGRTMLLVTHRLPADVPGRVLRLEP